MARTERPSNALFCILPHNEDDGISPIVMGDFAQSWGLSPNLGIGAGPGETRAHERSACSIRVFRALELRPLLLRNAIC